MDITPKIPAGASFINGYGRDNFRVNNQKFSGSIILSPTNTQIWQNSGGLFNEQSYNQIVELAPLEKSPNIILLIGTGSIYLAPPLEIMEFFKKHSLNPEIMSTPAACRTFNVLISEQRCVYAMLNCMNQN